MAEQIPNPEEQALRRRARRRLAGSLALALLAVLVLPMIFEPEPKPLGDDVEIVIPGQDTPFKSEAISASAPLAPAASTPAPTPAPEIAPPPAVHSNATATGQEMTKSKPAESVKQEAQGAKPVKPAEKPVEKPMIKPVQAKPSVKPETPPVAGSEAKPASKPEPKPAARTDDGTYFLQLGSFGAAANAQQLAEKAKAAGFVVKVLAGQGGHKVRVGPFLSKDKAIEAQAKLKAKGFTPVLVAP